jgi:hypothetical protein
LPESYLWHACSYHEILRLDTARQAHEGEHQRRGFAAAGGSIFARAWQPGVELGSRGRDGRSCGDFDE